MRPLVEAGIGLLVFSRSYAEMWRDCCDDVSRCERREHMPLNLDLPGFGVDANMFALDIVYSAVVFLHVLAVQIPSLDLRGLCEFIGSRHDV